LLSGAEGEAVDDLTLKTRELEEEEWGGGGASGREKIERVPLGQTAPSSSSKEHKSFGGEKSEGKLEKSFDLVLFFSLSLTLREKKRKKRLRLFSKPRAMTLQPPPPPPPTACRVLLRLKPSSSPDGIDDCCVDIVDDDDGDGGEGSKVLSSFFSFFPGFFFFDRHHASFKTNRNRFPFCRSLAPFFLQIHTPRQKSRVVVDRGDGSGLNQVRHSIGKEKRKMMVKREIDGMSEQSGSVAASLPVPTTLSLSFKPPEKKKKIQFSFDAVLGTDSTQEDVYQVRRQRRSGDEGRERGRGRRSRERERRRDALSLSHTSQPSSPAFPLPPAFSLFLQNRLASPTSSPGPSTASTGPCSPTGRPARARRTR